MKTTIPAGPPARRTGRQGSAIIIIIIIISLLGTLSALSVKIVYNYLASANSGLNREQAFWLAEAGLAKASVEIAHNPNWYTDTPYYPEDNVGWLINYAVGQINSLGEGSFKIVREMGKDRLYSIGLKGSGVVVLKSRFSPPPFKYLEWQEI